MTGVRRGEVDTARRIAGRRRRVVWLLARSEAWRLVRHPLVLIGAGLAVMLTRGANFFEWAAPVLHRDDAYVAMICAPLAVGTLLAANLATTRSRRDDADELFDPTPTDHAARTIGHLLSLLGPVLLATGVAVGWLVWAASLPGAVGTPRLAQVLHGPALVFTAGAIGVMVGRWTAFRVAPVLVLPILVFPLLLSETRGWLRWVAWFRQPSSSVVPELTVWPTVEHLGYLLGVGLLAAAVASLRDGLRPRRVTAVGVAGLVTVGSLIGQARAPTDADVAAAFELVQRPAQLHECETREGITSCVWPAYAPLIDRWQPLLAGAIAPLPTSLRPDLRVEMRPEGQALSDIVNAAGDPSGPGRWDRAFEQMMASIVHIQVRVDPLGGHTQGDRDTIVARPGWPGSMSAADTTFAWARAAAVRAVGFDPAPSLTELATTADDRQFWTHVDHWPGKDDGQPMPEVGQPYLAPSDCDTSGQARAVIALWLASQATDETAAYARTLADPADRLDRWWGSPEAVASPWIRTYFGGFVHADQASRQWAVDDLELAVQLLDRSAPEVGAALAAEWDRWTSPGATSAELQQSLGLDPPRTLDERLAAAGVSRDEVPAHAFDPAAWGSSEMTNASGRGSSEMTACA